ncbi:hypothetical protein [Haloarchaeobius sp. HME9146]|uniref:hypothetical protein n=1 Tax=Haloarchaeobius sp. HME9146 TaxID=2978732 RepID=UPI0021C16501|nr:hypothetical protein [Haloarchaeobius sp. HME9146]MCT9096996.1 hypothetical protein [Haloarchaeobius sp. HME9146]
MSTGNEAGASELRRPEEVEDGFLARNSWLKPFALVEVIFLVMLLLLDIANDMFTWMRGGFSQAIFGMILSLFVLALTAAVIVLMISAFRYVTED